MLSIFELLGEIDRHLRIGVVEHRCQRKRRRGEEIRRRLLDLLAA